MKNNYIVQAWLVLLLSLCFGGALAGVQIRLADRIAANKLAETLGQIPELVPGAQSGRQDTVAGTVVYRAEAGGSQVGWVVPCRGQGFADKIELLVGVDAGAQTISGVYVLGQKETPGLGNKIVDIEWRGQFTGKSAQEPLVVVKTGDTSGNQIDALTGATISSESVCQIVNKTLDELGDQLRAQR